jgi:hypothetical protein
MLRVYNWMASGLLLTGYRGVRRGQSTGLRGLFFQI